MNIKTFINKISVNPEFKKIIQNLGWLIGDKLWKYVIGLGIGVLVARYLGPQKYGVFNYAVAFVSLFGAIAGLGLKGIIVRELVKHPEKEKEILGSAFFLLLGAGIFAWLLSILTIFLIRPEDTITFWLVFILSSGFLFRSIHLLIFYYEAKVESKFTVFATNVAFITSTLLKLGIVFFDGSLIAFAIVSLLDIIITGVALSYIYLKNNESLKEWRFDFKISKKLFKDSYPLIFSAIMVIIYMKIDQIMLREMTTDKEAGIYAAAVKLTEIWYFFPGIIIASVFPNIEKSRKVSDALFLKKLEKLFRFVIGFSLFIAIPTSLLGGWVVNLLYGEEYSGAGPILQILIWALLFVSIGVARSVYILSMNFIKASFVFTALGAISNILLNYYFLPKYGGIGAAWSTLFSYALAAYFTNFMYPPMLKVGFMINRSFFFFSKTKDK